jgi:capsular exopolysaccharide synthesis family protein
MKPDSTSVSLEQALAVLRRRALLLAASVIIVTGAALGFSLREATEYTATASLIFTSNQTTDQVLGLQPTDTLTQQSQQDTNVKLVQLGDMAAKTAHLLGRGLTAHTVQKSVGVGAVGDTNVVDVSATNRSPTLATAIANTYSNEFVSEQQSENAGLFSSALALVNRELARETPQQAASAAGLALVSRAQTLAVLIQLRSGDVSVAQSAALPTAPSSPRTVRNVVLGVVVGLLFGLALVFLADRLDQRIKDPAELAVAHGGLPLLGVIAQSAALGRRGSGGVGSARRTLPPSDAETFRMIRARLRYFNVDRRVSTILVVSAGPGTGKSTVSSHIALTAAAMGTDTLLIELDLRRPVVAGRLGLRRGPGVTDVVIGSASLPMAIQTIECEPLAGDGQSTGRLDVLTAGFLTPPNPGTLVESHAMERLLHDAKGRYELVIIDTPPLTVVSDAYPLLQAVDGVIVVERMGRSRRDVARRLHETLAGLSSPVLGVIANGVRRRGGATYGYNYNYEARASSDLPAVEPSSGAARV